MRVFRKHAPFCFLGNSIEFPMVPCKNAGRRGVEPQSDFLCTKAGKCVKLKTVCCELSVGRKNGPDYDGNRNKIMNFRKQGMYGTTGIA